jgi:hypothetical protein
MDADEERTVDSTDDEWLLFADEPGAAGLDAVGLRKALEDASRLWLAHDGLWFLEFEKRRGMEEAIEADKAAWAVFTKLEARRIMARLGLEKGCGIAGLAEAFRHRLYSNVNRQRIEVSADGKRARLTMESCWVQETRRKKGLDDFPCKEVGLVEYGEFAKEIDPRIDVECRFCPPDSTPEGAFCRWEFSL